MKVPMMAAVRFDGSGVGVEQVRRVRPATGQVLVRVTAIAIDRADGETHIGPQPVRLDAAGGRTLGRHAVGTVAALGVGVDGWPLGRPVILQPEVRVRRGWFVPGVEHDGALAEYVVAPMKALVPLPEELSPSVGVQLSLAARAGSILAHARLAPGKSVGIWGAGALGCAAVAVARALGAAPIIVIDPRKEARAAARDLGADASLDPTEVGLPEHVQGLTGRRGFDVALHVAPDPEAAEQALAGLGPCGHGVLAGPAQRVGGIDRWDGRTLSGVPRVDAGVLPLLAHLASQGRLHLPTPPSLPDGLSAAAELLDAAVHGGSPVEPRMLSL